VQLSACGPWKVVVKSLGEEGVHELDLASAQLTDQTGGDKRPYGKRNPAELNLSGGSDQGRSKTGADHACHLGYVQHIGGQSTEARDE
jgi:hypothetical protein